MMASFSISLTHSYTLDTQLFSSTKSKEQTEALMARTSHEIVMFVPLQATLASSLLSSLTKSTVLDGLGYCPKLGAQKDNESQHCLRHLAVEAAVASSSNQIW